MTEIKEVYPKEDYQLEVLLTNGSSITLNLKSKLETIRFGLLKDETFFRCAKTNGAAIYWDHKVELSAGEVFELIRK